MILIKGKTKLRKRYNILIQVLIIILAYGFIYREIFYERDILHTLELIGQSVSSPKFLQGLILVFLIMFINWGVEAWKWRYLIKTIERISFLRSFKAVFTGITVSFFTPNRIGEFFGRVFILDKAKPLKAILITIIGSMAQLLTTLLVGSICMLIFIPNYFPEFYSDYFYLYIALIFIVFILDLFLVLLFLNISIITSFTQKIISSRWQKLRNYFNVFAEYHSRELLIVLLQSILRFLIFSTQFYLLLRIFDVNIPYPEGMMLIALVFFVLTAIPTIALSEIGVRGSVAIYFISQFFTSFGELPQPIKIGILSSATALWFINLALPAIVGAIFVFDLKFIRNREQV
ncbi:MAG: flippase-like domain-containing protein [Bacteroidales bacterium]|nr:flippase-like domain-containing protein [Bacteroidales bacterium]